MTLDALVYVSLVLLMALMVGVMWAVEHTQERRRNVRFDAQWRAHRAFMEKYRSQKGWR